MILIANILQWVCINRQFHSTSKSRTIKYCSLNNISVTAIGMSWAIVRSMKIAVIDSRQGIIDVRDLQTGSNVLSITAKDHKYEIYKIIEAHHVINIIRFLANWKSLELKALIVISNSLKIRNIGKVTNRNFPVFIVAYWPFMPNENIEIWTFLLFRM